MQLKTESQVWEGKLKNKLPKQMEKVYSIQIDVYNNGQSQMTCTMPNIHPASLITVLVNLCTTLAGKILERDTKPKLDIIDPMKLPASMRL